MATKTETPAKFDFAAIAVENAPVPEATRARKENPFGAAVAALAQTMTDDGRSATASSTVVPADAVPAAKRHLSLAGQDNGVSVRSIVDETDKGSRITFWTVTRIVRERKNKG